MARVLMLGRPRVSGRRMWRSASARSRPRRRRGLSVHAHARQAAPRAHGGVVGDQARESRIPGLRACQARMPRWMGAAPRQDARSLFPDRRRRAAQNADRDRRLHSPSRHAAPRTRVLAGPGSSGTYSRSRPTTSAMSGRAYFVGKLAAYDSRGRRNAFVTKEMR